MAGSIIATSAGLLRDLVVPARGLWLGSIVAPIAPPMPPPVAPPPQRQAPQRQAPTRPHQPPAPDEQPLPTPRELPQRCPMPGC